MHTVKWGRICQFGFDALPVPIAADNEELTLRKTGKWAAKCRDLAVSRDFNTFL